LTTLGKVIQILAKGDLMAFKTGYSQITSSSKKFGAGSGHGSLYTPFRESKLTRLLQDSIGGNCKTYLIATISPTDDCSDESISTIKFA